MPLKCCCCLHCLPRLLVALRRDTIQFSPDNTGNDSTWRSSNVKGAAIEKRGRSTEAVPPGFMVLGNFLVFSLSSYSFRLSGYLMSSHHLDNVLKKHEGKKVLYCIIIYKSSTQSRPCSCSSNWPQRPSSQSFQPSSVAFWGYVQAPATLSRRRPSFTGPRRRRARRICAWYG